MLKLSDIAKKILCQLLLKLMSWVPIYAVSTLDFCLNVLLLRLGLLLRGTYDWAWFRKWILAR